MNEYNPSIEFEIRALLVNKQAIALSRVINDDLDNELTEAFRQPYTNALEMAEYKLDLALKTYDKFTIAKVRKGLESEWSGIIRAAMPKIKGHIHRVALTHFKLDLELEDTMKFKVNYDGKEYMLYSIHGGYGDNYIFVDANKKVYTMNLKDMSLVDRNRLLAFVVDISDKHYAKL